MHYNTAKANDATQKEQRKTLRNNIKPLLTALEAEQPAKPDFTALLSDPIMQKRPEQLSVADFIGLTLRIEACIPEL